MERYKLYSNIIKDNISKKEMVSSAYYPTIPYRDSDIYIYSKSNHRLDILSYEYYGDQTFWWVIARANNLGKGSFMIPPGIRLRIPFPIDTLYLNELS